MGYDNNEQTVPVNCLAPPYLSLSVVFVFNVNCWNDNTVRRMKTYWRRKMVLTTLLTVLGWMSYNLVTRWSCIQARRIRAARKNEVRSQEQRSTVEQEMMVRSEHIQQICSKYQNRKNIVSGCEYRSIDPSFDQNIGDQFLKDPKTGSLYCFIHKVGSSEKNQQNPILT